MSICPGVKSGMHRDRPGHCVTCGHHHCQFCRLCIRCGCQQFSKSKKGK